MIRANNVVFMTCALAISAALSIGCSGDTGPRGNPGTNGEQGDPGDKGDKGDQGDPGDEDVASISLVDPRVAFLDRQAEISISGNATAWTKSAVVDFGADITVDDLIVASGTSLVAKITISDTAAVGLRDITISDKDANGMDVKVTYAGAFEIKAPLEFDGAAGTLAQGSIFLGHVAEKDLSTPFDNSGAPDYPNLLLDAGADIGLQIQDATTYGIQFLALVDVNAPAANTDVLAASGFAGAETFSLAPAAMPIAARLPVALTDGSTNTQTAGGPLDSQLFSFTTSERKLITITASSADPNAAPAFAFLPPSGKFADLISYGSQVKYVTETADPVYVVFWDNSGAANYSYDLKVETQDSGDVEPNNACAMAQDVGALPVSLQNLTISSATDEDWFLVKATAADVGKGIHVTTSAGDTNTDAYVEVFGGNCMNLTPLGGPSNDADFHEDHVSAAIPAAGNYWVRIRNSPDFPYSGALYNLNIELVAVEVEPNDTCGAAQSPALPVSIGNASLSSDTDQDWFRVTVSAADVGKQIHVVTSPGDDDTDTYVELFSGPCASATSIGTSDDGNYHEDFMSAPIATAGDYYVKISNSPSFPYAGANYKLTIDLITPPPPVDVEPGNNTCGGAQPATFPADISPLHLPDVTDEDWFAFTAAAADVGKVVHVVTSSPDLADTLVEVFAGPDCANLSSLGGPSDDSSYSEDWMSAPISAAGPVWVKVSYSSFGFSGTDYELVVTLE